MQPEKISFSLDQFHQPTPVQGIDLHNKTAEQLKSNFVACAGGKVYLLNDVEFKAIQGWLNDYPSRIQIADESVIHISPKGEQGVTSIRPY
ncbi:hypothetical protein [Pseudomonas protegens]|jgi:hypothetical protein|uniref:hypothetical protein n=1 Tax=Pseudomonas protegens TaxID=380021 RepID=UPI00215E6C3E|nr:hypothetical protein [Pseudomonas protegens]MDK1397939.1 hypothetical protein [Pseudomonas protegens]UVL69959.1 hypothetical protein LOY23_18065 [Pseudomonas protegens]